MKMLVRLLGALLASAVMALTSASVVSACSPPFEEPTIRALGPAQVVVVGSIGERVDGGRLFHVEQAFNGVKTTPILIAFKEGEPIGDCSYPVTTGQSLIIAPSVLPNGRLSADLTTLQADPASVDGQRYLAEAEALFGPAVVPVAARPTPESTPAEPGPAEIGVRPLLVVVGAGIGLFGVVIALARRRPAES